MLFKESSYPKIYNYDKTAESHSLSDKVREGILTRVGTLRNYRYIQKKPLFEK